MNHAFADKELCSQIEGLIRSHFQNMNKEVQALISTAAVMPVSERAGEYADEAEAALSDLLSNTTAYWDALLDPAEYMASRLSYEREVARENRAPLQAAE